MPQDFNLHIKELFCCNLTGQHHPQPGQLTETMDSFVEMGCNQCGRMIVLLGYDKHH
jgi:hypothetical protein